MNDRSSVFQVNFLEPSGRSRTAMSTAWSWCMRSLLFCFSFGKTHTSHFQNRQHRTLEATASVTTPPSEGQKSTKGKSSIQFSYPGPSLHIYADNLKWRLHRHFSESTGCALTLSVMLSVCIVIDSKGIQRKENPTHGVLLTHIWWGGSCSLGPQPKSLLT